MRNYTLRRGVVGRKGVFLVIAVAILPLAVTWAFDTDSVFSDEPAAIPADAPLDPSDEVFFKELKASADEISARELNECHLALLARMILASPNVLELKLRYGGIVSNDEGNKVLKLPIGVKYGGLRMHGNIGSPLRWNVSSEKSILVIFSFYITVRKTHLTVAEIPLKKRTLYVNVGFVDGNEEITKKRDDLGGVSVLEFVKRLEKGPADLEKNE